ncbi:unnamed protein product [Bursaphelenchus okinawaensis]|uniref:Saposin B-type domain-containing protein n=1 Tax=Bursaphelenchus okinawaensis TaxID=465554 RepID=A0A811K0K8_9BILA|nr:unnamed protein product [Bursaphelenchus okinawaensis]CAG9089255.1 unnamed protein product [Bursaphelenchus okinawaensis]
MAMKFALFVLLVAVANGAVVNKISDEDQELALEIEQAIREMNLDDFHATGYNPICEACKLGFTIAKRVLGNSNNITREALEKTLEITCSLIPKPLPGRKEFCENLGPAVIDLIYHIINEVDKGIVPEHDCQLIFLCPWNPETTVVPTETPLPTTRVTTTTVEPVTDNNF